MSRYVQRPSMDGIPILQQAPGWPEAVGDAGDIALEQGRFDARFGAYRPHLFPLLFQRQIYDQGWNEGRRRVTNVADVGPTLLALTASGAWPPRPLTLNEQNPSRAAARRFSRNPSAWTASAIPLAPPGFPV